MRSPTTAEKLIQEMDDKLQFPGLSNTWTMPVENRLDMELTGIKTPLGLKVQGAAVNGIQQLALQIQNLLSGLPALRSVFSEKLAQGSYGNVEVNRPAAARMASPSRIFKPELLPPSEAKTLKAGSAIPSASAISGTFVTTSLTIVGSDVIGIEYACIAAALDIPVTVIERRPRILDFVDQEIAEALSYHTRQPDDAGLTRFRREHVGFVFQFYNLILSLTALENVTLVKEIANDPIDPQEALRLVELREGEHHFPSQHSGGEQQRVAIARAIVKNLTSSPVASQREHWSFLPIRFRNSVGHLHGSKQQPIAIQAMLAAGE